MSAPQRKESRKRNARKFLRMRRESAAMESRGPLFGTFFLRAPSKDYATPRDSSASLCSKALSGASLFYLLTAKERISKSLRAARFFRFRCGRCRFRRRNLRLHTAQSFEKGDRERHGEHERRENRIPTARSVRRAVPSSKAKELSREYRKALASNRIGARRALYFPRPDRLAPP